MCDSTKLFVFSVITVLTIIQMAVYLNCQTFHFHEWYPDIIEKNFNNIFYRVDNFILSIIELITFSLLISNMILKLTKEEDIYRIGKSSKALPFNKAWFNNIHFNHLSKLGLS